MAKVKITVEVKSEIIVDTDMYPSDFTNQQIADMEAEQYDEWMLDYIKDISLKVECKEKGKPVTISY